MPTGSDLYINSHWNMVIRLGWYCFHIFCQRTFTYKLKGNILARVSKHKYHFPIILRVAPFSPFLFPLDKFLGYWIIWNHIIFY